MRIDKRLKIAIAAVVIAACAFGGYTYYQSQQKAKQAAAVETAEVDRIGDRDHQPRRFCRSIAEDHGSYQPGSGQGK